MDLELKNLTLNNRTEVEALSAECMQKEICIRGFAAAVRVTKSVVFVTVRDGLATIQTIIVKGQGFDEAKFGLDRLVPECFVECVGRVKEAKPLVAACTKQDIEVELTSLRILGQVLETLPFSLKDASATEKERAENASICEVSYSNRLNNRFLDLRMPQTQAIVRVMSGVMGMFREFLRRRKFIEIKTTKIIQSGSEGGSNLFSVDYFGKKAFLAQSPQLYKQMAIVGGLKRVFEIGHVYRAEQSNINRYLSEFTGLDIEMELDGSYLDLVKFIHSILVFIFDSLKEEYQDELEIIRKYRSFEEVKYENEPLIVTHRECVDILKGRGYAIGYEDDFNKEQEKMLGAVMKETRGLDLFVITGYPSCERAFYTYANKEGLTHSYDFILRGEEILSGAQRITDYEQLKKAIETKGIPVESLCEYLKPFKFGAPPHGGCGIGFERLLKSYFGFDDIRYFSLFPRDPNRLSP